MKMRHREAPGRIEFAGAAREHQYCRLASTLKMLDHQALIREDGVVRIGDVVPAEEVVVKEARRPSGRDNDPWADDLYVSRRSCKLSGTLLLRERLFGAFRELVDHWIPDRPAELQQADVDSPLYQEAIGVNGTAVIQVQNALFPIIYE